MAHRNCASGAFDARSARSRSPQSLFFRIFMTGAKADAGVMKILKNKDWGERLRALRASKAPEAQFLWAIFRDAFHYSAVHLATIADNARDVDLALRWGF